ncbi:MAG: hypothetical protein ACE5NM_10890 [Sedimentisphaerales bacterium]
MMSHEDTKAQRKEKWAKVNSGCISSFVGVETGIEAGRWKLGKKRASSFQNEHQYEHQQR